MAFVRRVYRQSFPRSERKPMAVILQNVRRGDMELLVVMEAGQPVGIVITALTDRTVLLDYFAMEKRVRGRGLGSRALQLVLERYGNRQFFLEIESTTAPGRDQALRQRRKSFYLRNGLFDTGHRIRLFGVDMELLSASPSLPYDACAAVYARLYSGRLANHVVLLTAGF
jgi:GNAT superfamily N-acetyltransferase